MKTTYNIDPAHSNTQFSVRHMMVTNVRGGFRKVTGTIVYDSDNLGASSVEATIDASTISTNEDQRDAHLRSADFLDVEHFPTITFKSKKIDRVDDGEEKVTGDLTIHGVTRQVVLNVEGPTPETKDAYGNLRIGLSAATKIKRSEFGLTWNAVLEAGGIAVGDDLKIEIDVSALKQA
jgi:polyisoprenoid-binding protein YceI